MAGGGHSDCAVVHSHGVTQPVLLVVRCATTVHGVHDMLVYSVTALLCRSVHCYQLLITRRIDL